MNWELFLAVITWCVTVLAFILTSGTLVMLDSDSTPKQRTAALYASVSGVLICVLGIATIVGMGWIS